IVNELITNALKHAFPDGKQGVIAVEFRHENDQMVLLKIADNGIGFPPSSDFRNSTSLGLKLVNSLVKQIGGTITLTADHGTAFAIQFRLMEK
ncbi:MAG: sensor histidine kinase, partial [Methanomicrobiales archaeon]|nr:sensor histidine kinase [Methanomicrobiales archaeon]